MGFWLDIVCQEIHGLAYHDGHFHTNRPCVDYRDDTEATPLNDHLSRELHDPLPALAPPPPQPHHQHSGTMVVLPSHQPQQSLQMMETIPSR